MPTSAAAVTANRMRRILTMIGRSLSMVMTPELKPSRRPASRPPAIESAILTTLPNGSYTAIVSGYNGGTGIGLIEVYNLR